MKRKSDDNERNLPAPEFVVYNAEPELTNTTQITPEIFRLSRYQRIGLLLATIALFAFGVVVGRETFTLQQGTPTALTPLDPTTTRQETPTPTNSDQDRPNTTDQQSNENTTATNSQNEGTPPSSMAPLPNSTGWELVGLQWSQRISVGPSNVITYQPTGNLSSVRLPGLSTDGRVSFAVTRNGAIVRPWDNTPGYRVTSDGNVHQLEGALARAAIAMPADSVDHFWIIVPDQDTVTISEVDSRGSLTGRQLSVPPDLKISLTSLSSDGTGYILGRGEKGIYRLGPDGPTQITNAPIIAAGATTFLTSNCLPEVSCNFEIVDRDTGARTELNYAPAPSYGVVSPDGNYAAIFIEETKSVALINLLTADRTSITDVVGNVDPDRMATIAFSPDSRYLLTVTTSGIVPVDADTFMQLPTIPATDVVAIAIRAAS